MKIGGLIRFKNVSLYSSPCVYIFFANGKPIYCGSSLHGICRPFHKRHESKARLICDEIAIQFYQTLKEARKEEQKFTLKYRPLYNKQVYTTLLSLKIRTAEKKRQLAERRKQAQFKNWPPRAGFAGKNIPK